MDDNAPLLWNEDDEEIAVMSPATNKAWPAIAGKWAELPVVLRNGYPYGKAIVTTRVALERMEGPPPAEIQALIDRIDGMLLEEESR